jgi:hypothetical protein
MPYPCWTDRRIPPLLRRILDEEGVTFPPSGPYHLYLPRTSGRFTVASRRLSVPDGVWFGALAGCGYLTGKRASWVRLVQTYGRAHAITLAPRTWLLDHDGDRDLLAARFTPGLYVLKAPREHRRGLTLVRELSDILAVRQDIVQRVITDGLAIEGRRVQLRLYLLLTQHAGTLTARLYDDGRCLYGAADGDPFEVYLHTRQVHPREGLPTTLRGLIADPRFSPGAALPETLARCIGQVFAAARPKLLASDHLDHARCFQLLGVDVIFTAEGRPVFIEANKGPSLVPTSRDDERFKRRMLRRMLATVGVIEGDASGFSPLPERAAPPRPAR